MAKRTVTKTLPDGRTVSTTSGCFGRTIAIVFALSLIIWAIVGPAKEYSPAEAALVYLGMILVIGFIIWAVVRYQRKVKAQQSPGTVTSAAGTRRLCRVLKRNQHPRSRCPRPVFSS